MANPNDTSSIKQAIPVSVDSAVEATRGLYIGTGGDVAVIPRDGGSVKTFKNVPDGTILPMSVIKVATGTTASDILALY